MMGNNMRFVLIVSLLLFSAGMVSHALAGDVVSTVALDDGPALFGSFPTAQNESNTSTEKIADKKTDSPTDSDVEQSGPAMPQLNPTQDSPDAPVKTNVEEPAGEKTEIQKPEEQQKSTSEAEPNTPADDLNAKPAANDQTKSEPPAVVVPPKVKRELNPAQVALRDKVRRTLAAYQKMPFNTRQNSTDEIINYCMAMGCNTEISLYDASGEKRVNGITCLCWNYPLNGYAPLKMIDGHIAARLGYGTQSKPSQLIAALALARVQPTYPMRVGEAVRSIADLIESEKSTCRTGTDMSLKLIGLSYYVEEGTWKNNLDEEWSLEKIVKEELAQPVPTSSVAGLDRLLGLSYSVYRRDKRNLPIDGQYARAKKYIADFQTYAFAAQNPDGSWGRFLSGKGVNRDAALGLRSSGHVLQWLAFSLPEDRLEDPAMMAGIAYLNNTLSQRYQSNLPTLSSQEISGAMRALHALSIYDERLFKPADSEQPAVEKKPVTAKREVNAGQSR